MKKIKQPWRRDLDRLSEKQIAKYEDSLEVLRLMRNGDTMNVASKKVRISPPTAKRYLGSAIKSKNNRLIPRKSDNLLRKVRIYENGKETFIQTKGRKNVSILAEYLGAVGRATDQGNVDDLKQFENKTIIDYKGKHHKLETEIEKLREIQEKREEREFFTIYHRR